MDEAATVRGWTFANRALLFLLLLFFVLSFSRYLHKACRQVIYKWNGRACRRCLIKVSKMHVSGRIMITQQANYLVVLVTYFNGI